MFQQPVTTWICVVCMHYLLDKYVQLLFMHAAIMCCKCVCCAMLPCHLMLCTINASMIHSWGAQPAVPQLSPTGKQVTVAGGGSYFLCAHCHSSHWRHSAVADMRSLLEWLHSWHPQILSAWHCPSDASGCCSRAHWRGGSSDWPTAQQQTWQQQQQQRDSQSSFAGNGLGNGLGSGDAWQLDAAGLSPASHGSSSDCLADALAATLQHCSSDDCGGDTLDAAADCLSAWPGGCGSQPTDSIRISDAPVQLPLGQPGPCSDTQHGIAVSAGLSSPCRSAGGATAIAADSTPVDWQSLLEAWALPPDAAAAVVPPPLEALLAEEDALPLTSQPPAQQLPAPQSLASKPLVPSLALSLQPLPHDSARPQAESAPDQPRQLRSPPAAPLADAHPAAMPPVPRRARSFRNRRQAAQPSAEVSQPAPARLASTRSRRQASRSAKATDAAAANHTAQAAAAASAVPAPAAVAAASRKLTPATVQPPPSPQQEQQQQQQAEAATEASRMPAIPQPPPPLQRAASGPRKRGRPRVYDTVTPVLEAAALERQPSGPPGAPGFSGAPEEPPRKRRGAKPKYICATQEEAIAKRCVLV